MGSLVLSLNQENIDKFFREGFVLVRRVFSPPEVASMIEAFDSLERQAAHLAGTCLHGGAQFVVEQSDGKAPVRIRRVVWCGAAEPVLDRFGTDPRLLGMASQLLGSDELDQLICQAHFKRPGDDVSFPWHQDSSRRRYGTPEWVDVNGRGSYVQIVIALDQMDADNGPLQVVPGSCALGHLEPPAGTGGALPAEWFEVSRARPLRMAGGDALLMGPYTIHGSEPNRSFRPRRAFLAGFASPGANRRTYPGAGTGRRLRVPSTAQP